MNNWRRLLPDNPTSNPASRDRLRERGFEEALSRAWARDPETIIRDVADSGLLGRGGAAFPTGKKWESVRQAPGTVKYVVMNADESEPGTFKDRALLQHDPMGAITGLYIAARAVGASRGYIYVRGEYRPLEDLLRRALAQVHDAVTHLGGQAMPVELRFGAGAYIAGEETALFNSIEGKRPEPRVKPPFPTTHGLFGSPTVIQNVETLANVALIFAHGTTWFRAMGTQETPGTKLVAVSGHVKRPGVYEVPFGTPLSTILHHPDLAGGVAGSGRLGAVLMGGAAGTFLRPFEVDEAVLDYRPLRQFNASPGSGAVMVFDDAVDLTTVVSGLARFFAEESCGQCVPCRIGTRRILEWMESGAWRSRLADLRELAQAMRDASICGLGQTAPMALMSWLDRPELAPQAIGQGGVDSE